MRCPPGEGQATASANEVGEGLVIGADNEPSQADWTKGVICTDSGDLVARPGLCMEELLRTPLRGAVMVQRRAPAHVWVTTEPVMIGGYECVARLQFGSVLSHVEIVVTEGTAQRFGFETGFAATYHGPEVAFLEEWVRRETGRKPPVCFGWGGIGQVQDQIAGYNRISFRYGPEWAG